MEFLSWIAHILDEEFVLSYPAISANELLDFVENLKNAWCSMLHLQCVSYVT